MSVVNSCIIHGDSFTDNSWETWDQWADIVRHSLGLVIDNKAVGGDDIILEIEPGYATEVAARKADCTFAIIQGGVNDFAKSATVANVTAALESCITTAQTAGLGVIVLNVAPWGASVNWTSDRQTLTEDYNAYLTANASSLGITVVDIYTPLGDSGTPANLAAAYDSGDGLHPSAAGQAVIATAVESAIVSGGFLTTVSDVANELKMWKGAVEPDETTASGNEIKIWKGAVEPAAPIAAGLSFVRNIARNLVRNTVRNTAS